MKIFLIAVLAVLYIGLFGCSGQDEADAYDDIYVITNRFFSQQMRNIFNEPGRHIGRTIQYRGVFISQAWDTTGESFYFVAQFHYDCCGRGMEDFVGFVVYLNDIPSVSDFVWVEVTGVLEDYYAAGVGMVLRVNAISMEVLEDPALWI